MGVVMRALRSIDAWVWRQQGQRDETNNDKSPELPPLSVFVCIQNQTSQARTPTQGPFHVHTTSLSLYSFCRSSAQPFGQQHPPISTREPHSATHKQRPAHPSTSTRHNKTHNKKKPLIRFRNPWTTMTHAAIHASTSKARERRALRCVGRAREEGRVTRCSRTHERYVTHT